MTKLTRKQIVWTMDVSDTAYNDKPRRSLNIRLFLIGSDGQWDSVAHLSGNDYADGHGMNMTAYMNNTQELDELQTTVDALRAFIGRGDKITTESVKSALRTTSQGAYDWRVGMGAWVRLEDLQRTLCIVDGYAFEDEDKEAVESFGPIYADNEEDGRIELINRMVKAGRADLVARMIKTRASIYTYTPRDADVPERSDIRSPFVPLPKWEPEPEPAEQVEIADLVEAPAE